MLDKNVNNYIDSTVPHSFALEFQCAPTERVIESMHTGTRDVNNVELLKRIYT